VNTRLVGCALGLAILTTANANAQVDVGITPSALVSFQPIDDAYVGSPYLSEGIGGPGPGLSGGFNVITAKGFVIGAEYTTAWFEQEQSGRLVLGGFPLESIPATTKLRDSMIGILAGYATSGSTRIAFLGGVGARLDRTTIDGVEAEKYDNDEEGELLPITGGVDVMRSLSSRAQFVISGRYTYNQRHTRLQYLGIGPHIIRAGAGVRIRLN
jgi:hypothetical protein